jgi:hypothetical protein
MRTQLMNEKGKSDDYITLTIPSLSPKPQQLKSQLDSLDDNNSVILYSKAPNNEVSVLLSTYNSNNNNNNSAFDEDIEKITCV